MVTVSDQHQQLLGLRPFAQSDSPSTQPPWEPDAVSVYKAVRLCAGASMAMALDPALRLRSGRLIDRYAKEFFPMLAAGGSDDHVLVKAAKSQALPVDSAAGQWPHEVDIPGRIKAAQGPLLAAARACFEKARPDARQLFSYSTVQHQEAEDLAIDLHIATHVAFGFGLESAMVERHRETALTVARAAVDIKTTSTSLKAIALLSPVLSARGEGDREISEAIRDVLTELKVRDPELSHVMWGPLQSPARLADAARPLELANHVLRDRVRQAAPKPQLPVALERPHRQATTAIERADNTRKSS